MPAQETEYGVRAVIQVDGFELEQELDEIIEQVLIDENVQLPAMFSITLLDPERDILDRTGLRVGAEVEISTIAQVDHPDAPLVKGDVVSVECDYDQVGTRIIVRGYAPTHRLHRGRQTRTFLNATDSEMIQKVAEEAGIEIGTIASTSKLHEHVAQANVSDWEFITARARDIGYEVTIVEGKLEFGPPRDASEAPGEIDVDTESDPTDPRQLVFGKNLLGFHGRLSAAEQVAEIEVRGWDTETKQPVVATAPAKTVAAQLELSDPSSMAHFFGDATFVAVDRPVLNEPQANSAAKAIADRIGSAFVEADGVARGHPELRAGAAVSINGVGEDFSGKYVLTHTRHLIDREGYHTHFTVSGRHDRSLLGMVGSGTSRMNALGGGNSPTMAGFVRGLVSDNADPENLGRVKVSLPWLNDEFSSAWAPVMQLGAGPESGTMFLPAVNDEVLVGFEHGMVDRPVVIGGLFNGVDKPPTYTQYLDNGSVVRRAIVSRLGHQIAFADNANGDSGIVLTTKDATVGIGLNARDQKLYVHSNGAIEITADGEMSLKASKINLQADGELVLKGAQIKLN